MAKFSYAYASRQDECNYYSKKYFQINNCGALRVLKKDGFISLRKPRKDYILLYLYSGEGWAEINGVRNDMYQGDILFIKPGAPLNYGLTYDSMFFWIHFTGCAVDDMFSECGISKTEIYKIGVSNDLWNNLTDVYLSHSFNSNSSIIQSKGTFINFLSKLAKILNPGYNQIEVERENKIYPALKEMNINYNENHKLEYYASLCGISLSNFQHLFTKITGVTPQKYLISIRMDVAKKMLISSKLSIKEVAFAIGYEDPLYFSRIFKKSTGFSPKEYIKKFEKQ